MNKSNNPWLSIWTEPRSTIRQIVTENPKKSLGWLSLIYGFPIVLNWFQSLGLGDQMGMLGLLFLGFVLAPIWGYLAICVWSLVTNWTGKWLKGKGSFQTIRAAFAWSSVPIIVSAVLWLIAVLLFGREMFSSMSQDTFSHGSALLLLLILLAKVVFAIWSIVLYVNALAEVQQFSVLRTLVNLLLAGTLFFLVCMAFVFLIVQLLGAPAEVSALMLTGMQRVIQ